MLVSLSHILVFLILRSFSRSILNVLQSTRSQTTLELHSKFDDELPLCIFCKTSHWNNWTVYDKEMHSSNQTAYLSDKLWNALYVSLISSKAIKLTLAKTLSQPTLAFHPVIIFLPQTENFFHKKNWLPARLSRHWLTQLMMINVSNVLQNVLQKYISILAVTELYYALLIIFK